MKPTKHRKPRPEKKPPPRKPVELAADELLEQLRQVPELDFFPLAERMKADIRKAVADKLRRANLTGVDANNRKRLLEEVGRVEFTNNVNVPVLEAAPA